MDDKILISREIFEDLNIRVKNLAVEKSYLILITHLMTQMGTVSGLENTIQKLLEVTLNNIGGSNLIIYYMIGNEIHYSDVLGQSQQIKQIEDQAVSRVFETKVFVEVQNGFENTKLTNPILENAYTWIFPLMAGSDFIGVFKIENLYIKTTDIRYHLPLFFDYAAHIIKNEILDQTKLKIAYDQLREEIGLRKQAEIELVKLNEQLRKLNAEKDKFFSIIAHDLRSPLSSFLGFTELMAEKGGNMAFERYQEYALCFRKSVVNLFHLIENLLQWARQQRGLISFNPSVVHLHSLVNECIELSLASARNKGVEITSEIPCNLSVYADSNMLQTVIRNLLSNAVKFTHKGGYISLSANIVDDKNVEISIKDNGIGMSEAMVKDLFRIDVSTKREGTDGEPSTGLGLLLCKEFIEKQGGKIWVESEVLKGTTFHFTVLFYKY